MLGAGELAASIRRGERSSREALDEVRRRIEAHNPALNAVVTLDLERAEERAAAADDALARGEVWGPLHGVPMTIKDAFETEGLRTTSGAPALAGHVPTTDAVAVARLRAAGVVIAGKTNLPIHAGDLQTSNELFGTTNNPWDLTRTPGGSSGGAAAAVASGMVPLELGSDIGGSIRNPAHYCGIYGLKPSYGLVPTRGHIPPEPGSLVQPDVGVAGPLARSVADLALAFDVLAGPDDETGVGWRLDLPRPEPRPDVAGLRIGWCDDDPTLPISAASRAVLRAGIDRLADAGATVVEIAMPVPLRDAVRAWQDLVLAVIGAGLPEELYGSFSANPALATTDADLVGRTLPAMVPTFRTWERALNDREHLRRRWAAAVDGYDVVLLPVMPSEAHPHDVERPFPMRVLDVDGEAVSHSLMLGWCGAVGVMLVPAAAVPVSLTADGLPVGVQVVGPMYHDHVVLDAARVIDEVLGGVGPPLAFP